MLQSKHLLWLLLGMAAWVGDTKGRLFKPEASSSFKGGFRQHYKNTHSSKRSGMTKRKHGK